MSEQYKPIIAPEILKQQRYATQTEMLAVSERKAQFIIGIPKETTLQENRVALVPASVATLIAHGHRVMIEKGAGEKSRFNDIDYSEVGAEIATDRKQVFKADMIIKVAPPTLDEIDLLQIDQMIISPLHIPIITAEYIHKLKEKRVTALAMEYLQDDDGTYPVVRIMSEIAGISSMQTAAELLTNSTGGMGVLLGGVSGVPPAKIVILGAGVVAEFATRTAIGLGATVRIFDNNIYKLQRIQTRIGRPLYTSSLNPFYLQRELLDADVAIGAIHSKTGRAPMIVSEDIIRQMKPGSVIIDVSIDQGGCFETSRVTTHDKPTFIKHGVIHYCVPNIASRVARTASMAVSNILTPILAKAGDAPTIEQLLYIHPGLRQGVYTYKGTLTNQYLGERFGIKTTNLDLLLSSDR